MHSHCRRRNAFGQPFLTGLESLNSHPTLTSLPLTQPMHGCGREAKMNTATRAALIVKACSHCTEIHVFVDLHITEWTRDQAWNECTMWLMKYAYSLVCVCLCLLLLSTLWVPVIDLAIFCFTRTGRIDPGPLFNKTNGRSSEVSKPRNWMLYCLYRHANWQHPGSAAIDVFLKFESDWKSLNMNLVSSRLHEILE